MKAPLILILTIGLTAVMADPVSKQTDTSDKEKSLTSESPITIEENKDKPEQKKAGSENSESTSPTNLVDDTKYGGGELDIIIEEQFTPDNEVIPQENNNVRDYPFVNENVFHNDEDEIIPKPEFDIGDYTIVNKNIFRKDPVQSLQDEIMETAAGFVPIRIWKRKQNNAGRNRFATRRYYQRYPHRRNPFYYPYYGFYRPSSLRFY